MATKISAFSFEVENKPGSFAAIAEVIAKENVNIEGCTGTVCEGKGFILINTNNSQTAASALKKAGFKYETQELLEIKVQDKPGELAKILRALADAGVNITSQYLTMKQTVVFAVDNILSATKALQKLGL